MPSHAPFTVTFSVFAGRGVAALARIQESVVWVGHLETVSHAGPPRCLRKLMQAEQRGRRG